MISQKKTDTGWSQKASYAVFPKLHLISGCSVMSVIFFKLIPQLCNTQMGLDLPQHSVPTLHLCLYPAHPAGSLSLWIGLPWLTRRPSLGVTHDKTQWFIIRGQVQGCQDRTQCSSSNRPLSRSKELPMIEVYRCTQHLLVSFGAGDTALLFNCHSLESWQSSNTLLYLTFTDQYDPSPLLLAQMQLYCHSCEKKCIPKWEGLVTVGV